MQTKYQAYVYLVKNKITNQFYYGSRASNIRFKRHPLEDLWIYYFTSSKKIKELINLHGKDTFEIQIVFSDDSYETCFWEEQRLISKSKDDPLRLNRVFVNKETNTRILTTYGESATAKETRIKKMQVTKKGKFNSNGHLGLTHSNETKQKMKESQKKLNYKHSDTTKQKMKEYKRTPEHAAKLGESLKGKPWSEARRQAYLKRKQHGKPTV
jgi:hypothetical protein